ncbi:hypothetical protein EB796_004515 [Bugula neritina]|uniref:Uncharacterized protein n=1 Tax=Bugula neritina TaxID=10212 RepID=A0A7J7KH21_BUGNE|nr:hypothetical protein EB796_004515 [Bugula neritina]
MCSLSLLVEPAGVSASHQECRQCLGICYLGLSECRQRSSPLPAALLAESADTVHSGRRCLCLHSHLPADVQGIPGTRPVPQCHVSLLRHPLSPTAIPELRLHGEPGVSAESGGFFLRILPESSVSQHHSVSQPLQPSPALSTQQTNMAPMGLQQTALHQPPYLQSNMSAAVAASSQHFPQAMLMSSPSVVSR